MEEEFTKVHITNCKAIAMVKHVFTNEEIKLRMSIIEPLLKYAKEIGKTNWKGDKERIICDLNSLLSTIQNNNSLWTTNNKELNDYAQYLFDLHAHIWKDVLEPPMFSDRERHKGYSPFTTWEECDICHYRRRKC